MSFLLSQELSFHTPVHSDLISEEHIPLTEFPTRSFCSGFTWFDVFHLLHSTNGDDELSHSWAAEIPAIITTLPDMVSVSTFKFLWGRRGTGEAQCPCDWWGCGRADVACEIPCMSCVCAGSWRSREGRGMRLPDPSFMVSGQLLNPICEPFPSHVWVTTPWAAEHTFKYLKEDFGVWSCYHACWWNDECPHHKLFAFAFITLSRPDSNNFRSAPSSPFSIFIPISSC